MVTKDKLDENNTTYAQGGIAVAMADKDTIAKHTKDTLAAGQRLCNASVVKTIVSEAPAG